MVTLSCIVTYNRVGDERRVNPGADMTASVSWETAAGTEVRQVTLLCYVRCSLTLSVRLSVCHADRQQQRRLARLLLSALRASCIHRVK